MSADEIIKHIPEIASAAKSLAAVGAAIPFTAIVKRMLGPAADELAEVWKERVRFYRFGRQAECLRKAAQILTDERITPDSVKPKILFPLLDGASFEEDENIHDMWSALLANAASPEDAPKVRPGFIAFLRQMAPDEALLLQWMYDNRANYPGTYPKTDMMFALVQKGFDVTAPQCIYSLEATSLIRISRSSDEEFNLTLLGHDFIHACRPPKTYNRQSNLKSKVKRKSKKKS